MVIDAGIATDENLKMLNQKGYKLKNRGIHHDWQNIIRIMNTQKAGTITMNQKNGKQINKRVCSVPSANVQEIYSATNYLVFIGINMWFCI